MANNHLTESLICCPIGTRVWRAATEIMVSNLQTPSVVVANLVMTLDWMQCKARKEAEAEPGVMDVVLLRVLPLIGAERFFDAAAE